MGQIANSEWRNGSQICAELSRSVSAAMVLGIYFLFFFSFFCFVFLSACSACLQHFGFHVFTLCNRSELPLFILQDLNPKKLGV